MKIAPFLKGLRNKTSLPLLSVLPLGFHTLLVDLLVGNGHHASSAGMRDMPGRCPSLILGLGHETLHLVRIFIKKFHSFLSKE